MTPEQIQAFIGSDEQAQAMQIRVAKLNVSKEFAIAALPEAMALIHRAEANRPEAKNDAEMGASVAAVAWAAADAMVAEFEDRLVEATSPVLCRPSDNEVN